MEQDKERIGSSATAVSERHRARWRFYGRAVWVLTVTWFWIPWGVALPRARKYLPLVADPFLHTERLIAVFLLAAILLAIYVYCGWLLRGYCFFRAETAERTRLFSYYRSDAAKPVRDRMREHLLGSALAILIVTALLGLGGMLCTLF